MAKSAMGSVIGLLIFGLSGSQSVACDLTQLKVQFVGFYQYGTVGLCEKGHEEGSTDRYQPGPCTKKFKSENTPRAEQIISKVKAGDGYSLKEIFASWVYVTNGDSEARKHFDGCADYGSYLAAARHAVSCYPHAGGPFIGYGNPAPPEAQAIGIKVCQE